MHVKSVESSNFLPSVWLLGAGMPAQRDITDVVEDRMIKFPSSLGVYRGAKLVETAATPGSKTSFTQLAMELKWAGITEIGNSFRIASNLCHTSSTVLAGEE
ncbi:hypothetical protein TNCV_935361 [Trichonephila clavipes]|nr:hypothetical protein TNCV_935361 [Trichonephila clavipes]